MASVPLAKSAWCLTCIMHQQLMCLLLVPGFGVMASVLLANSALGLACIVCLFTLLIGPITLTLYRYAAFLFIITLHTIILCQCVTPLSGMRSRVSGLQW